jgi:hypothetical protein
VRVTWTDSLRAVRVRSFNAVMLPRPGLVAIESAGGDSGREMASR